MTEFPAPNGSRSALPLVLTGAVLATFGFWVVDALGTNRPAPSAQPREVAARGDLAPLEQNFIEVFERCSPSVAHITTRAVSRGFVSSAGSGSGFLWDDAGTVVTNWHVVENATRIQVAFGERRFRAELVARRPEHDLAVLRLVGDVNGLAPLPVGTSADLRVGQTAIAIGNPFGFDQTLTTGVVSALNRDIGTPEGRRLGGLIQVEAAINPGNSGGPLLDSAGRLIGVTTAIYSPSGASAGIGFAVPVDVVNQVVPEMLGARAAVPVLGVRNETPYRYWTIEEPDTGFTHGAIFTEVVEGYGAATAGLVPFGIVADGRVVQWGDVVCAIGKSRVRTFDEIGTALRQVGDAQEVELTLLRGLPDAPRLERIRVPLRKL